MASQEPGGRRPAPGRLRLVQEFLNTRDKLAGTDVLHDPATLDAWLIAHHLRGSVEGATPSDLEHALRLREALRALTWTNNGGPVLPSAYKVLNDTAGRVGLTLQFGPSEPPLPGVAEPGVLGALGSILAGAADAMLAASWARLKRCANEQCEWVYYDHSRNASGAWCTMRLCGNRAKKHAYRARRRAEGRPAR